MVGVVARPFRGLWPRWSGRRGYFFISTAPMVGAALPNGRGGVLIFNHAANACAGCFHFPDGTGVGGTSNRALHW